MNLLALDIGNSSVKAAYFEDASLLEVFRFSAADVDALDYWLETRSPDAAACVSVVPSATQFLSDRLQRRWKLDLVGLNAFSRLPFAMAYRTPETVGADRIAAAAGAWARTGGESDLIVIDAGTALTVEVVSRSEGYLGGVIAPGPVLLAEGLGRGTAQLPRTEVNPAVPVIGRSTVEAMQSGVFHGFVGTVRHLLAEVATGLDPGHRVFLTGGWAHALAAHLPDTAAMAPHLVLEGVCELYGRQP